MTEPKKNPAKKKAKPRARKTSATTAKPAMIAVVPVAADGWPACPNHLKRSAQAVWAKGEPLWNRGEITVQDVDAYLMYCEAFDELDHCYAVLAQQGEYQESSQGGFQEHPALRRIRAVEGKIFRYQRLFGLVPEARKKRPAVQQGVATRKRT
jgi:P27 family predicted phage terminase small subunit